MPKILVTGATGFIGRHLVRRLVKQGQQVQCMVRKSSNRQHLPESDVEFVISDFTDAASLGQAVRGCDTVYHLAGQTSGSRATLNLMNARGCQKLSAACAQQTTPPTLVIVSSLAAAGTSPINHMRTAETPAIPVSNYGRSKRAGELAALQYASRVPTSIVRPGIVFGPENTEVFPIFQSISQLHLHAVPGFSSRRVSLIHSEDLIDLLLLTARHGKRIQQSQDGDSSATHNGIYFAADPQQPSLHQLGRMVGKAVNAGPLLILPIAEPIAWLVAGCAELASHVLGISQSFNTDKMREAFAGNWINSMEREMHELGFRPKQTLQVRLDQTADWYRQHGWLPSSPEHSVGPSS